MHVFFSEIRCISRRIRSRIELASTITFFFLPSILLNKKRCLSEFPTDSIDDLQLVGLGLLGFTGFYYVFLGSIEFYWVILGSTGPYWVLLGFTGFYWIFLDFTEFYRILLGFIGFLCSTGFYWALQKF